MARNKSENKGSRRHGSTEFFVLLDYLFLAGFFGFLFYFLLTQIWPEAISTIVPFVSH